ncbi:MAG: binding domain of DNA repair protein Ercc1-domain-containing protein, partial [Olpidium bornovanus]
EGFFSLLVEFSPPLSLLAEGSQPAPLPDTRAQFPAAAREATAPRLLSRTRFLLGEGPAVTDGPYAGRGTTTARTLRLLVVVQRRPPDPALRRCRFTSPGTPPPHQPVAEARSVSTPPRRPRGNPILVSVRNVPYEYGEVVPDYVVGQTSCALFLSLKYHRLHPDYILD